MNALTTDDKKINCPIRVMVADDFQTTRKSIKLILRSMNYLHIEEAIDGRDALLKIEEDNKIGLIFLDWNMPKMSGLTLLKELKKDPSKNWIKIIMITAESQSENIVAAVQAGVDEYIIKPVTKDAITEKVHKVVNLEVAKTLQKIRDKVNSLKKREASMQSELRDVLWDSVRDLKSSYQYFPWLPDPHYEVGLLYRDLGDLNKAAEEFENALLLDERHARASVALGNIYLKRKQGKRALRVLEVVAARRSTTDVLQALGEAYLESGETNKAISTFKKSIRIVEAVQKGKFQEAEANKMAEKHEGLGKAYLTKFDETQQMEWNEKSVEAFNKSLKFNPRYISAHFNLMTAYKNAGDTVKLQETLKKVSAITPDDSEGWIKLASTYLNQNANDKAAFAFKRAIHFSPSLSHTYFEIGNIYINHDLDMALRFLNKSLELEASQPHVHNKLGIIYRKKGNHAEAIHHYQEALKIDPNDEFVLYNSASAYLDSRQTEKAIDALEKAITISPGFNKAINLLQSVKKLKGIG